MHAEEAEEAGDSARLEAECMEFGMALNIMGATAGPDLLVRLAREAEDSGLDAIWVGDHVVFPREMPNNYPYTDSALYFQQSQDEALEAITVLTFLAGVVSRPKLGLSVLVIPYRNPVLMTKVLTTLDVLSGGRAVLGAGTGWLRGEFEALGADYDNRGAVTDEYLRIYRTLCTEENPSYEGQHYRFPAIGFYPKPVQKPWPPIWIGGNSEVAMRRATKLGDGWHPVGLTPEEIPARLLRFREICESLGRDPDEVAFSLRIWVHVEDGSTSLDGMPVGSGSLIGRPQELLSTIRRYEDAGVRHLVFKPLFIKSAKVFADQMLRFINEVVARV
jgi:probable F420-dependent oxidoreductase